MLELVLANTGSAIYAIIHFFQIDDWSKQFIPTCTPLSISLRVIIRSTRPFPWFNTPVFLHQQHHAFRSYLGLTCLMQTSTREKDYIVDPLTLRGKLTILNEVFTNPKITKVSVV